MSIMDILGGGQPPQPDQGPPPEGPDHEQMIRDILESVRMAAQGADDEQEALTWEKISTLVQQILAQQEKQSQELLGGKFSPNAINRALG